MKMIALRAAVIVLAFFIASVNPLHLLDAYSAILLSFLVIVQLLSKYSILPTIKYILSFGYINKSGITNSMILSILAISSLLLASLSAIINLISENSNLQEGIAVSFLPIFYATLYYYLIKKED